MLLGNRDRPSRVRVQHSQRSRADSYWTAEGTGEVRLRQGKDPVTGAAPLTVHDMLQYTAMRYANYIALGCKQWNRWYLLTYVEYYELCRQAAKAFLKLGLRRFSGVGIMGLNSEEWVIASIGAIMAGGFSVGILSTSSPKVCQSVAERSKVTVFVVDGDRQLQKVIQVQDSLRHLRAIVQYKEVIRTAQPNLYSWQEFLDLAEDISDETLDHVIDSQKPNQCCTLVCSMEAKGPPKILMLSHDNITWTTMATVQSLSYKCPPEGQEVLVSYLPLSCIGAQIFDVWVAIAVAGSLYFGPADAEDLSGTVRPPGIGYLAKLLQEVQPTTFHGVPWVWEYMLDSLRTRHLQSTAFRQYIDKWAMAVGLNTNKRRMFGDLHRPLSFYLAKRLTFLRARRLLGLTRCTQFFNMGPGLPRATLDFFLSLDIPIYELYGMSECTGVHTLSTQQDFRLLSCGKGLPNTHTKVEWKDLEGIGTISVWGRNIFMGYLQDSASTAQKIDTFGWMHTGDLGFLDVNNFLYITGNIRDMITLSSGEMVNPRPIEERVKTYIPLVHYAVVVGQGAPGLGALLTLKCQVNWDTGKPEAVLTSEAVALCQSLGSPATRLADVTGNKDPVVVEFISQGIEAVNAEAPSASARIVHWVVLDTDFSVGGGELGVTAKLKRAAVEKIYQTEIMGFYSHK